MVGRTLKAKYNGYTSCPIVTGGTGCSFCAEFDYNGEPDESFWFDQSRERRSMWWLEEVRVASTIWHGMLKGRA